MMDPSQDLLLAALSESGISPNDLFDSDSLDVGLLAPSTTPNTQQPPSTTTFVLNQINQLPTLGNTVVMTKPTPVSTNRQTITVAKILQTSATTRPTTTAPAVRTALSTVPVKDQIQLKDLLKNSSLNELMKLKPPPNIAQPVATAAKIYVLSQKVVNSTKPADLSNGAKKDISSKDVSRIWINDDLKMRSFSPTLNCSEVEEILNNLKNKQQRRNTGRPNRTSDGDETLLNGFLRSNHNPRNLMCPL